MFWHIFSYRFWILIRNRTLVGWTFLFPLLLSTAFYLGFGNLIHEDPDIFSPVPCGYVQTKDTSGNATHETSFTQVLASLSASPGSGDSSAADASPGSGDSSAADASPGLGDSSAADASSSGKILQLTTFRSATDAEAALRKGSIDGFYEEKNGKITLTVKENGLSSTILNQIRREYQNSAQLLTHLAKEHPEKLSETVSLLMKDNSFLEPHRFGDGVSPYLSYFFSLLAMAALYGSWLSTESLRGMCAHLSEQGKRYECSPVGKLRSIFAGSLAGIVLQSISSLLIVLYTEYVLGISFGAPLTAILPVLLLGNAVGNALGMLAGALIRNDTGLWLVPLGVAMVSSFLSGLMIGNIRQFIEQVCPLINRINPASVFTDALCVAANYGCIDAYYNDLIVLAAMYAIAVSCSSLLLRRRNYASI
jgi:ABC-2 type transport system permease protein